MVIWSQFCWTFWKNFNEYAIKVYLYKLSKSALEGKPRQIEHYFGIFNDGNIMKRENLGKSGYNALIYY